MLNRYKMYLISTKWVKGNHHGVAMFLAKTYRARVGPVGKGFQKPTFSCGTDVVYYYSCHFIEF